MVVSLGICLPPRTTRSGAACACLAFGFACEAHRTSVRRKTYRPPIQLLPPLRPPSRPCCPRSHCRCHRWVVAVIITSIIALLRSQSPGIVRIPHARFRPVAIHQPPRPPSSPRRSAISVPPLSDDRQTGRRTDTQSVRQTTSRQLRKPGNTKSPSLLDCVTRPLASCNILCNTIPQSAHASYALQYPQLASSAISVPRLPPRLALAHRAAAAS
jgi:hypothetical protein